MTEEVINGVSNNSTSAVISQTTDDDPIDLRDSAGTYYIAQTFQPGTDYTITAVEVKLLKTGSPSGYVWIELWNTLSNEPSSLISGAISTKIKASDISGSATQYKFYLPKGISVASGTTYAVVINCDYSVDASNYITVRANTGGGLTPGQAYTGTSAGDDWTGVGIDDLWIKLYQGTLVPVVLSHLNQIPHGAGAYVYVPRSPTGWDYSAAYIFTVHNGQWQLNGLDTSNIVPAGAVAVKLLIICHSENTQKRFALRRDSGYLAFEYYIDVANQWCGSTEFTIECDSDRKFDYLSDLDGTSGVNRDIGVAVIGWYI